ncbi:Ig-like domain-containing protein [Vallitalea guaymasensis]|uniref:Ig-like domain-containing protein n=1 Tax=Vallitalea guaymasensis TaxID=1185412 RepID=UPI00272BC064|nr:Ig-like domain-containing protein [Vallitalea guaymasensis]
MKKNFKGKIGLFLAIMFVTLILSPKTLLANTEGDSDNPCIIYLKGVELNLEEGRREKRSVVEDSGLYIISFEGPIEEYMKNDITKLGVELIEYIPDFAFLSRMNSNTISDVSLLSYVNKIVSYQPEYKINPVLKSKRRTTRSITLEDLNEKDITVKIFTVDDSSILDAYIEEFGGTKIDSTENEVIVKLNPSDVERFASLDSVKYIEPVVEFELFNDKARDFMGVNSVNNLGYNGSGQVVAVCDTGIDTGVNDSGMHSDFQGRIDSIFPLGRSTADDIHGHGTHVAGSVLGDGTRSNGQIKGIAPEAHLVFQSVLDSGGGLGGLPNDLNDLFQQAANAGAHIHTNSWGAAVGGQYTGSSQDVDEYVWNNKNMIILFAAGNEGDGYSGTVYNSIGSPGTAKNCITVGATENNRPNMPNTKWGNIGDNPNEIAPFSSRGNCDDGRVKPDIVAPGTWVLSAKSSVAPSSNFWADYNNYYAYMGGTSMSTPLTAGAVAAARGYMQDVWNHTPSAALMKAAIINGGTDLGFGFPSKDQGWGRVNLADSLKNKEYEYSDQAYSLATGATQNFTYTIESTSTPLTISLVWSDYPGSTAASKALVNDLDIKVTSPSGTVYYGNDFTQPYNSDYDRLNNVENIYIDSPETGNYSVEVKGYNVPQGPQSFALFASADFGTAIVDDVAPTCNITSPSNGDTVNAMLAIEANAEDNVAVSKVEFYVDNNKIGEVTAAPYNFNWNTNTVNNGNYNLKVKAIDTSNNEATSSEITVTVNNVIDDEAPTCNITSPANGDDVNGTININADAQDNIAVNKVEFYVDNNKIGEDTTSPYSFEWDTTTVSNASHTLKVKAIDTSDNEGLSNEITVAVDNAPTVEYKTETFTGSASIFNSPQIDIDVTANGTIDLQLSGSSSSLKMKLYDPSGSLLATNKSSISYDATETGTYSIVVSAFSFFGADYTLTATYPVVSTQDEDIDSVEDSTETVEPTEVIADGDIISDIMTIDTYVDENKSIKLIELYVDENKVMEFTEIPEAIEWDTTTVDNGNHEIQVKITDESGNVITSTTLNVVVENDMSE